MSRLSLVIALAVIHASAGTAFADAPAKTAVDGATIPAERMNVLQGDTITVAERVEGVIVLSVEPGGAFHALGLRAGDQIIAIDGSYIEEPATFESLRSRMLTKDVTYIEVVRKKKPLLLRRVVTGRVAAPPTPAVEDDLGQYVTHLGGNRWEVDADAILADPLKMSKGARITPSVKDGKPYGFKLYAIRPSSIFAKLGLTNGDTITRMNGMELESMDKALEVYTKLRDAKEITVDIIRRGKPLTHVYVRKGKAAGKRP